MNGKKEIVSLSINPEVVDKSDVGMLEELILTAIRQAAEKAEETARERMGSLPGGMGITGL